MKVCTVCGEEKEDKRFCKGHKKCNQCRNILYNRPAVERNRDKYSAIKKEYAEKHKDRLKLYRQEYYLENKILINKKSKIYRDNNKDSINSDKKRYNNSLALYSSVFKEKLVKYETIVLVDKNLLGVNCAYCGKVFVPTNGQVSARKCSIEGTSLGENRLYCSAECKVACPTYRQRLYYKGKRLGNSREVPAEFRHIALKDRNYTCEKCGSTENGLHVHHKEGYTEQPMLAADLPNVLVLCKACHKAVHDKKGCYYINYACNT